MEGEQPGYTTFPQCSDPCEVAMSVAEVVSKPEGFPATTLDAEADPELDVDHPDDEGIEWTGQQDAHPAEVGIIFHTQNHELHLPS